jgi:hypothetical protein
MKLSTSVEQQILSSIVQGKNLLDEAVLRLTKPEYFQVDAYQWLVRHLIPRRWRPFDVGYLDQLLLEVKDDQQRAQYKLQLENLYYMQVTFGDDAVESFKSYLSFCVVNSTLVKSSEGYKGSQRIDYWLRDLQEGIDTAQHILTGDSFRSVDFVSDFSNRVDARRQVRDNPAFAPRILTGIQGLDLQFVIRGPQIINFLAPFKRYKSIFLNSLGFAALLQGFNVLHVTLENDYNLTAARYDTMFSLLTYDRISGLFLTQEELDNLRRLFDWMQTWDNRLKIVKGHAYNTSAKTIANEIERLKRSEGFVPDVVVVDYMNILSSTKAGKEERQEQNDIVWELKDVGETYKCPIITASQATRAASTSERVKMDQQGKSVGISQAVDLTIAIDQTPEERAGGIIVLSPMFSRAGPILIPEITLDSDLSRMLVSRSLPDLWAKAKEIHPF